MRNHEVAQPTCGGTPDAFAHKLPRMRAHISLDLEQAYHRQTCFFLTSAIGQAGLQQHSLCGKQRGNCQKGAG